MWPEVRLLLPVHGSSWDTSSLHSGIRTAAPGRSCRVWAHPAPAAARWCRPLRFGEAPARSRTWRGITWASAQVRLPPEMEQQASIAFHRKVRNGIKTLNIVKVHRESHSSLFSPSSVEDNLQVLNHTNSNGISQGNKMYHFRILFQLIFLLSQQMFINIFVLGTILDRNTNAVLFLSQWCNKYVSYEYTSLKYYNMLYIIL